MKTTATWISNGRTKPFYARRVIEIRKEIKEAVAAVCGLGQFHFYINGEKVGNHELDPGWTNYDKLVQYVEFDVTGCLTVGRNVLGAEVGNGWYHMEQERYFMSMPPKNPAFSFMPSNPNPYRPFGPCLALLVSVTVTYTDGSIEHFVTDGQWKTCPHEVTMANVYGSEIIDGRLQQKGFSRECFADDCWEAAHVLSEWEQPKGKLVKQEQPPVTVKCRYRALYLHNIEDREIWDFGQNTSAILDFRIRGKKGDRVHFFPAEKLSAEGDVDQVAKGWTPIDVCITYIVGEDDVWENCRLKFTYFAGRYLGIEREGNNSAQLEEIVADAVTSASPDAGSFSCDDRRLEAVYDLVHKSVESNLLSVHTDCPTIERYAWQEANHLMAPSIMYMKDVRLLWKKILQDLRADQCGEDTWFYGRNGERVYPGKGLLPSQAPYYEVNSVQATPGIGNFYDTIAWGSAGILAVYWHYLFYGDVRIIQENYEMGKDYLSYLRTKVTEEGFISHGLGDWGNPDKQGFARENVETAFFYADAKTMAYFAEVLGLEEDRQAFVACAECIKRNYNEKLLVKNEELNCWCYRVWDHPEEIYMTQASQALPLYWGLVPEEREEDVKKAFLHTLQKAGTIVSGEIGLPYIIQTMSACGWQDLILDFVLRKEHPGYYAFVLDGETTLGEYWEHNPRSHNHDMMGHIMEWYYNGIAGIAPLEPGFQRIRIRPYLPVGTTFFQCAYSSVNGEIQVSVKEEADRICARITLPEGMACELDDVYLKKRKAQVDWMTERRISQAKAEKAD